MPPPPPTFSMITCWPKISDRRAPRIRASTSDPLPAGNVTTMVTGRVGQSCAAAGMIAAASAAPAMMLLMRDTAVLRFTDLASRVRAYDAGKHSPIPNVPPSGGSGPPHHRRGEVLERRCAELLHRGARLGAQDFKH